VGGGVNEYRTPEEERASREQEARIQLVLEQAVEDGAWILAAMELDEPQDVVERRTNEFWDNLRSGLSGCNGHPRLRARSEDPFVALQMLLDDRMRIVADLIVASVRSQ
jgi:hypothetical protein